MGNDTSNSTYKIDGKRKIDASYATKTKNYQIGVNPVKPVWNQPNASGKSTLDGYLTIQNSSSSMTFAQSRKKGERNHVKKTKIAS